MACSCKGGQTKVTTVKQVVKKTNNTPKEPQKNITRVRRTVFNGLH